MYFQREWHANARHALAQRVTKLYAVRVRAVPLYTIFAAQFSIIWHSKQTQTTECMGDISVTSHSEKVPHLGDY